jgi:ubiquinone/menaquinone biosynthesis C-methylase UbiE
MRLLSSNWLRTATRSMRIHQPKLYMALNSVRNRALSGGTGLAAYQASAVRRFRATVLRRPAGMTVLEVGSDVEGRVLLYLASLGVAEAVGVNPAEELWSDTSSDRVTLAGQATLHRADARSLPFRDGCFDAIFSVATFEHILDLPLALGEMYRVLRPGGAVYSNFGPIWSGCKGHHVRVRVGGREFLHNHPDKNPLPDFAHLMLSRDELAATLTARLDATCAQAIVTWVYDDPAINRLFFHEYLSAFAQSRFQVASMRRERDPVHDQLDALLRLRHPQESSFDTTNCEVILRKRT